MRFFDHMPKTKKEKMSNKEKYKEYDDSSDLQIGRRGRPRGQPSFSFRSTRLGTSRPNSPRCPNNNPKRGDVNARDGMDRVAPF